MGQNLWVNVYVRDEELLQNQLSHSFLYCVTEVIHGMERATLVLTVPIHEECFVWHSDCDMYFANWV